MTTGSGCDILRSAYVAACADTSTIKRRSRIWALVAIAAIVGLGSGCDPDDTDNILPPHSPGVADSLSYDIISQDGRFLPAALHVGSLATIYPVLARSATPSSPSAVGLRVEPSQSAAGAPVVVAEADSMGEISYISVSGIMQARRVTGDEASDAWNVRLDGSQEVIRVPVPRTARVAGRSSGLDRGPINAQTNREWVVHSVCDPAFTDPEDPVGHIDVDHLTVSYEPKSTISLMPHRILPVHRLREGVYVAIDNIGFSELELAQLCRHAESIEDFLGALEVTLETIACSAVIVGTGEGVAVCAGIVLITDMLHRLAGFIASAVMPECLEIATVVHDWQEEHYNDAYLVVEAVSRNGAIYEQRLDLAITSRSDPVIIPWSVTEPVVQASWLPESNDVLLDYISGSCEPGEDVYLDITALATGTEQLDPYMRNYLWTVRYWASAGIMGWPVRMSCLPCRSYRVDWVSHEGDRIAASADIVAAPDNQPDFMWASCDTFHRSNYPVYEEYGGFFDLRSNRSPDEDDLVYLAIDKKWWNAPLGSPNWRDYSIRVDSFAPSTDGYDATSTTPLACGGAGFDAETAVTYCEVDARLRVSSEYSTIDLTEEVTVRLWIGIGGSRMSARAQIDWEGAWMFPELPQVLEFEISESYESSDGMTLWY